MTIQERRLHSHVPVGGFNVVTEWAGEPLSTAGWDLGRQTSGFLARSIESLKAWRIRRATQKQLATLSDRMLRDIGIERHEIDDSVRVARWPKARNFETHMLLERIRSPLRDR